MGPLGLIPCLRRVLWGACSRRLRRKGVRRAGALRVVVGEKPNNRVLVMNLVSDATSFIEMNTVDMQSCGNAVINV